MTGTNQQALAAQAALAFQMMACMAAMTVAAQNQPYVATPESAAKTRAALYGEGLRNVPGPRKPKAKKLTADEQIKANAAKLGYVNGRFVGC